MKVIEKIKKIFIGIFITVFSIFALIMTILLLNFNDYGVTEFGESSLIIIRREISSENYKKGDLVIVNKVSFDTIKVGDEVFAYGVDAKQKANVEVGEVGEILNESKTIVYKNAAKSGFSEEFIIGKASKRYEGIGSVLSFIESKWGFLFVVLVPCFIIFIYELYALIVEIRYGDEDEK